jgi:predicted esterase
MLEDARAPGDTLRRGLAYLAEAGLHGQAGRIEAGLDALERALADGCRYKREWLVHDDRLAPLRDAPRFADIAARAAERYERDAAEARPRLSFAVPDDPPDAFGYPLLLVLHGNNSNARVTAPHWSPLADAGWLVAVPQSSEIASTPDAYLWNDRERTAREVAAHLERLRQISQVDEGRIVLAGFSMGALQALALPLEKRVRARGVVAVAPWLSHARDLTALVESGAGRMLRVFVVIGGDDPSHAGARELQSGFSRHGVRVELDVRAGLGHEYPADMPGTLARALAFVSA